MSTFRILAPAKLLSPWLLDALRASVGTAISVEGYAREEESRDLLSSGAFDLAALPDTAIFPLLRASLLLPLPEALSSPLPADPQFLHHYFDSTNQHAWPFGFTLLAIGGPGTPTALPSHWKELATGGIPFRPPPSPLYSRFLFAALAHGFPPSPAALADQRGPTAPPGQENARVEIDFAQRLEARTGVPGWIVHIPSEGSWIRLLHWTIPRGCASVKAAAAALQTLYRPETLGRLTSEARLAATVREARQAVPAELLRNPNLYPPESLLDHCVFARVDWLSPSSPAP
ncbi:hypothetical protein [Methylacidimicrobium sp. B4]|uniref:hypothetical protein n=1 Tax=Methylacidimicrobium sp. B4 TaxID=2796139 RepID=UPI001A8F6304|nr:hypothetical protein [Methylacidimicrobium sp. B4]QSR85607.1 hypothetical protein MacB4_05145 [Methylacidimicrobium sp. B4]